jgi:transposase
MLRITLSANGSLYCCSDCLRGHGAAVTYLSHNASFHSKEQIAPLKRGSKHFPPESKKGGRGRLIGQTKGGMNTKRHAVTEGNGRPVRFFITAGQVIDYTGAAALMHGLSEADWLLADRGYDADWFRKGLIEWGTRPCIAGRKSPKTTIKYDTRRYKRRNRIERMFGKIKDWRRVATRDDRSPIVFLSAIMLAATVIFWLCVLSLKSFEVSIEAPAYCVLPKSHHLADQRSVSMAQIANEPMVDLSRPVAAAYYRRLCTTQSKVFSIAALASSTEMITALSALAMDVQFSICSP